MKDWKKIVNVFNLTVILGSGVCISLIYFIGKYYYQAKLVFAENNFLIFIIFCLVIFWLFIFIFIQNNQLKKNDSIIINLLNYIVTKQDYIISEQEINHDSMCKLSLNSRKILLDYINKESSNNKNAQ